MKIEQTEAYLIKPWRIRDVETQYIIYLDFNKLPEVYKKNASVVAESETSTPDKYVYFAIVHHMPAAGNLVVPERTQGGLNIMMLRRNWFDIIYNNQNIAVNKVHFIGYLSRRTVKFIVRQIAGFWGRTK